MRLVSRKPFQLSSLKSEVLAALEALVFHVEPGVPPTTLYLCPLPFPPCAYKVLSSTQPWDTTFPVFPLFPGPLGLPQSTPFQISASLFQTSQNSLVSKILVETPTSYPKPCSSKSPPPSL